jgi:hypothetical protein
MLISLFHNHTLWDEQTHTHTLKLRTSVSGLSSERVSCCSIWVFPWAGEAMFFGEPLFDGSETRLVVRECLPEDAGAYTCVAENRAGKTSSSAAVCVRGKTTHTHTQCWSELRSLVYHTQVSETLVCHLLRWYSLWLYFAWTPTTQRVNCTPVKV